MARSSGILAALTVAVLAWPAVAADVLGTWSTEADKSHVEIVECSTAPAKLCGSIVWLKEPNDEAGKPKTDLNNPDEAQRARPIIGLALLSGFVPDITEKGRWTDGEIYNPEDGETYSCTMELLPDGRLEVRGYVGLPIFGKSQIWTRVN